jgi:hypothetical protein
MSIGVQQVLPTMPNDISYPLLNSQIIQSVFPANIYVNALTYYSIIDQGIPAVTFVLQKEPTFTPTLAPINEGSDIPIDMTPYTTDTVTPDFWGLGIRIPRRVIEDLQIPIMNDYNNRLMLRTAYTRDKHAERTINAALTTASQTYGHSDNGTTPFNFIGFTGTNFDVLDTLSSYDIKTAKKGVEKYNYLISDILMNPVNASDLLMVPHFVSAFVYGKTSLNDNALQQSTAPIGLLHGYSVWSSNVTAAGSAYFLASNGANVNNQFSPLGYWVEKRPPLAEQMFWAPDDTFRVYVTARFKGYISRPRAGFVITDLATA